MNDNINIISYNVCWEALEGMKSKFLDMTYCGKSPNNTCVNNIAKIIAFDGLKLINNIYDFICLQEIKNIPSQLIELEKDINNINPNFLLNYKYVITQINIAGIITMYNKNKYTLIKSLDCNFDSTADRPFHILLFKEGIIYINLHAPNIREIIELNKLETREQKIKEKFKLLKKSIENKLLLLNVELKNYKIIISGDFNDDIDNDFLNFTKFTLNKEKSISTCCIPNPMPIQNYSRNYDHILVSYNNFNFFTFNKFQQSKYIKDNKSFMSDHLPVFAIIKSINRKNIVNKNKRYIYS
jgi:exonuclease III